jgi:hypothetical protein
VEGNIIQEQGMVVDETPSLQPSDQPPTISSHPLPHKSHLLPSSFGVYHLSLSRAYTFGHSLEDARYRPLGKVAINDGWTFQRNRRHLVMHLPSIPESATARLLYSDKVDIWLRHPNGEELHILPRYKAQYGSGFPFRIPLPDGTIETFHWEKTYGSEYTFLNRSLGDKLIRENTRRVVALWARPRHRYNKLGKMAWIGERDPREELGVWFELAAVMSRVAGLYRDRRIDASRSRVVYAS